LESTETPGKTAVYRERPLNRVQLECSGAHREDSANSATIPKVAQFAPGYKRSPRPLLEAAEVVGHPDRRDGHPSLAAEVPATQGVLLSRSARRVPRTDLAPPFRSPAGKSSNAPPKMALQIPKPSGAALDRSAFSRALINGVPLAHIDFSECASEEEVCDLIAFRVRS